MCIRDSPRAADHGYYGRHRHKLVEQPVVQSTPSTDIPFFELKDAVVRRNGKDILRIPSLIVYEQESVALLGPNGAGKSTLLHLLTREVLPLHREIPPVRFRGQARPLLSEVRSAVGIVSATMQEEINLHLSALDIVIGGLFGTVGIPLRHTVTEEEKAVAQRALDEMGIGSDVYKRQTHEGGTHLDGFKQALTRTINEYARNRGLLKEKDPNLSGDDAREGLAAIISVKLREPQFEGQTKTKLGNTEIRGLVQTAVAQGLGEYLEVSHGQLIIEDNLGRGAVVTLSINENNEQTITTQHSQDLLYPCLLYTSVPLGVGSTPDFLSGPSDSLFLQTAAFVSRVG